jgi:hypothetical protein
MNNDRKVTLTRKTNETDINITLNIDGNYANLPLLDIIKDMAITNKRIAGLKLENLTLMANIYEMIPLTYYLNAKLNYITGESSIRKYPIDLPYGQYEQYEKEHNTIKHKKTRCK